MNNTQILEAAIEKAWLQSMRIFVSDDQDDEFVSFDVGPDVYRYNSFYSFIFSKDFAKAFWGEEEAIVSIREGIVMYPRLWVSGEKPPKTQEWQFRLQQMVISDDPIQYLKAFLK